METSSNKIKFAIFNIINIAITIFQIYYIIQAFQYFGLNSYLAATLAFILICFNSYFLSRLQNTPITAFLKIIGSLASIAFIFIGAYMASHINLIIAIFLSIWTIIANITIFYISHKNQK